MSHRISFLCEARQDIKDITSYLSQYYASTARNFATKLKKQVNQLKTLPLMYPVYEDDQLYRRMVIDDYLLFYSVEEKRNLVIIHRIFHSKRDVSQQLLSYNNRMDE